MKQPTEPFDFNGRILKTAGNYDTTLQTTNGCDSIVTLNLVVNKVYNDTISAVIKEGNTFDLYNFYEDQEGVYSQYLTSSKGCDSTVTLVLDVDKDAKLFIPNAFTPLDRYNNAFCVYPQEEIVHLKSFKIFNRWGTLLWQTDDITQCWNGTYQGKFVPQGAYVYKVEYYRDTEPNEIFEEKGSIMVLY